jgi:hypothetical protein
LYLNNWKNSVVWEMEVKRKEEKITLCQWLEWRMLNIGVSNIITLISNSCSFNDIEYYFNKLNLPSEKKSSTKKMDGFYLIKTYHITSFYIALVNDIGSQIKDLKSQDEIKHF